MLKNRLIYLLLLAVSAVLFVIHGAWFYWIVLLALLALPFVSLLFSLPSILSLKMHILIPPEATVHLPVRLQLQATCGKWIPLPACRFTMEIVEGMTGTVQQEKFNTASQDTAYLFTPAHCGSYEIRVQKCRVFDALSLWKLPHKVQQAQTVTVLPQKERPENSTAVEKLQPVAFQPKAGGGYSETHDHREYRPGDSVKEIRWKLSCKNDKLIVREPLVPVQQLVVAVQPATDADELDRALARLNWVSDYLIGKELPHTVFWHSGSAVLSEQVKAEADVTRMLRRAVCSVPTGLQSLPLDACAGAQILYVSGRESGVRL